MSHDLHTHSTYSDGADTLDDNLARAVERRLSSIGFSDHVRADTTWLPEYLTHVAALRRSAPIEILCGVETKMLDTAGRLDLPADLAGVDYVAIADHQMPTAAGPVHPDVVAVRLRSGALAPVDAVEQLVTAMEAAVVHAPCQPMLAHAFSLLPKIGLDEGALPPALLRRLAHTLRQTGALVEANEKWRCPRPETLGVLARAGVTIVAGSDAHAASDVGRFPWLNGAHRGAPWTRSADPLVA